MFSFKIFLLDSTCLQKLSREAKDNIFSYAFIAEPFFLRSMRLFYSNLMIFMFLNTAVKKTVGKKLRASLILPLVVSVILQSIRTDIYIHILMHACICISVAFISVFSLILDLAGIFRCKHGCILVSLF